MAQRTDYWREFWLCAICGCTNVRDDTVGLDHYSPSATEREGDLCVECGSTWRQRATVVAVLHGLTSMSGPICTRPHDHSVRGLGISDDSLVAAALARSFNYVNTVLHGFPCLDLTETSDISEKFDFVTCSEVLEHVIPPVAKSIANLHGLLSNNGFAVVSVPVYADTFREHYPNLASWHGDSEGVTWTDWSGEIHEEPSPHFHGGDGDTLELREWSAATLRDALLREGFSSVEAAPILPTLGVPQVPYMGVYIARP